MTRRCPTSTFTAVSGHEAAKLAAAMKMDVAIIWDDGGDGSFEETIIAPWLRDGVTDQRMAATLELRGQGDVSDRVAEQDADGLYAWLGGCGVIDEALTPADWPVEAMEMGHMETILAPQPGVLIFEKELGDFVEEGQRFARILRRPGIRPPKWCCTPSRSRANGHPLSGSAGASGHGGGEIHRQPGLAQLERRVARPLTRPRWRVWRQHRPLSPHDLEQRCAVGL